MEYKFLISNKYEGATIRSHINVKWEAPPRGVHMFNIDGLADPQPGPEGLEGVFRNHEGT